MKNFKSIFLAMMLLVMSASALQAQTLNILTPEPTVLRFSTTTIGMPQFGTVTFSVLDIEELARLFSPLTVVEIVGANADQFAIDSNDIDILQILYSLLGGRPIDIEVAYNPNEVGTHMAILQISLPSILGVKTVLGSAELKGVAIE